MAQSGAKGVHQLLNLHVHDASSPFGSLNPMGTINRLRLSWNNDATLVKYFFFFLV